MNDPGVASDNLARTVHDLSCRIRLGAEALDEAGIVAVGDEADVLAVGLVGHDQPRLGSQRPHLRLGQFADRKAQQGELLEGGPEQEIALVARGVAALVKLGPAVAHHTADIVAGDQRIGAKLTRKGMKVGELDPLVAQGTGHRRAAAGIIVGEAIDHLGPEPAFIVEHIVGDAEAVADRGGVGDVLPGAAGARTLHRFAMIVELERHPDHLRPAARGEHGRDAAVDPARHGDDDPRSRNGTIKLKRLGHSVRSLPAIHPLSLVPVEGRYVTGGTQDVERDRQPDDGGAGVALGRTGRGAEQPRAVR